MTLSEILTNDEGKYFIFSPVRGRRYLVARGNTVIREIFYDSITEAPSLPFKFLVPVFERIHRFPFTFKTLMSEQQAIDRGLEPLVTYGQNTNQIGESSDKIKTQKMCMVTRTIKDQYYLLNRELHPFDISILSTDGSELKFIFQFATRIDSAQTVVTDFPLGNVMVYAEGLIVNKLNEILRKLTFDELRGGIKDGIKNELETIAKELNTNEFQIHGFAILQIIHEATIIPLNTQLRINAEQSIPIAEKTREALIITTEGTARAKIIIAESTATSTKITEEAIILMAAKNVKDVGFANTELIKNNLNAINKFELKNKSILDETQIAVAHKLGQTKGVLVFGNNELTSTNNKLVDTIIANTIQTNQKGGTHGS